MALSPRESRAVGQALQLLTQLESIGDQLIRLNEVVVATGIGADIATVTPEELVEVNSGYVYIDPDDYASAIQLLLTFVTWLDTVPGGGETRKRRLILRSVSLNA